MDTVVARTLESRARRHEVRVLLVRRPGSHPDRRTAFLAHTTREQTWIEAVPFEDPHERLDVDLALLHEPTPPGIGAADSPEAIFLVCTNGRHDACCADLGRPVVRALKAAGVEDVWEVSHVGGDRFAANLVALPSGVYLGRVEPDDAADVVAGLRSGTIPLEHYRGRSCFPPLVQAAEIVLRSHLDERRIDGLRFVRGERLGPDELRVCFDVEGTGRHEVVVRRRRAATASLTCTAGSPVQPWAYEQVSVTPSS